MRAPSCNRCGRPAEYTISLLISMIGGSSGRPKDGEAIPFCRECLLVWIVKIGAVEPRTLERSAWRGYGEIAVDPHLMQSGIFGRKTKEPL